jgi:hypothetical protein
MSAIAMRFLHSYLFLFDQPGWPRNLALGSVCLLVPLVGPVAFLGYLVELLAALHVSGGRQGVAFDLQRFDRYLGQGWRPALLLGLLYGPLLLLFGLLGLGLKALEAPHEIAEPLWSAGLLCLALSCLLLALVAMPLFLRTARTGRLGLDTASDFFRDFAQRVWAELLLACVFAFVTGQVLLLGGLGLLLVGVLPAAVVVGFSKCHLLHQLYALYLERGGSALEGTGRQPEDAPAQPA